MGTSKSSLFSVRKQYYCSVTIHRFKNCTEFLKGFLCFRFAKEKRKQIYYQSLAGKEYQQKLTTTVHANVFSRQSFMWKQRANENIKVQGKRWWVPSASTTFEVDIVKLKVLAQHGPVWLLNILFQAYEWKLNFRKLNINLQFVVSILETKRFIVWIPIQCHFLVL